MHLLDAIFQPSGDLPLLLHQGLVLLDHGGSGGVQVGELHGPLQLLVLLLETPDDLHVGQPGGDLSLEVPGRDWKLLDLCKKMYIVKL